MPPTNRFFEATIHDFQGGVLDKLAAESQRADEVGRELTNSIKELSLRLDDFNGKLASLEEQMRHVEKRTASLSYINMEYSASLLHDNARSARVLLIGWYGANNCGDELMLRTMLKHFEGKGVQLSVLLWDYVHYDVSDFPEFVQVLHYPPSIWHLQQLASSFDVLVWGGGAILDDLQYTDDPFNYNTGNLYIRLSTMMLDRGKRVYSVGLSSNASFSSGEYVHKLARIVSESEYFSLRDEFSVRAFRDAGMETAKIHLCEDIVFGDPVLQRSDLPRAHGKGKLVVGIVLFCFDGHTDHNIQLLSALGTYFHERGIDFEVKLIPFYDYYESDKCYLEMIRERIGSPDWVSIAGYSSTIEENAIFDCDAVICYRYHAALLAGAKGIRSLFVCNDSHPHYPNKIAHLANLFDYQQNTVDESALNESNFWAYFDKIMPPAPAPSVNNELFEEADKWLESVCSSIAFSVKCTRE